MGSTVPSSISYTVRRPSHGETKAAGSASKGRIPGRMRRTKQSLKHFRSWVKYSDMSIAFARTNGRIRSADTRESIKCPTMRDMTGIVSIRRTLLPTGVLYKKSNIYFIDLNNAIIKNSTAPMQHSIRTPFIPGFLTSILDTKRYPTRSITP